MTSFKVLKRTLHHTNQVFHIFLDQIEYAQQKIIPDFLVVEPKIKTPEGFTGVAILPLFELAKGKKGVGLIEIFRHPVNQSIWEIPRGFIDPGEDLKLSALRELNEETGLNLTPNDLESLGSYMPEPGVISARVMLFVARIKGEYNPQFKSTELGHGQFKIFEWNDALKMTQSQIQDSATLVALLRLNAFF